mmetsp:Transcript_14258/g.42512  ORF Transcript_14258/g.42512 Transcript_14258/m.42512 type:complete len:151 (+) Transcript_14258:123-575(+)
MESQLLEQQIMIDGVLNFEGKCPNGCTDTRAEMPEQEKCTTEGSGNEFSSASGDDTYSGACEDDADHEDGEDAMYEQPPGLAELLEESGFSQCPPGAVVRHQITGLAFTVSNSFLCFGLAAEDDIWAEMPPLRRCFSAPSIPNLLSYKVA